MLRVHNEHSSSLFSSRSHIESIERVSDAKKSGGKCCRKSAIFGSKTTLDCCQLLSIEYQVKYVDYGSKKNIFSTLPYSKSFLSWIRRTADILLLLCFREHSALSQDGWHLPAAAAAGLPEPLLGPEGGHPEGEWAPLHGHRGVLWPAELQERSGSTNSLSSSQSSLLNSWSF